MQTGYQKIKDHFKRHGVDIENLNSWSKLDELRLLCNVIKHADGDAAPILMKRNKSLFYVMYHKDAYGRDLETTLLDESLQISQELFNSYGENIMAFWNELPERSYEN